MEDSEEKDCSFLFPNLYDALVYERKFKSEYLERQIYERSLKSEPFIEKRIENKSDLSKLTLGWSNITILRNNFIKQRILLWDIKQFHVLLKIYA